MVAFVTIIGRTAVAKEVLQLYMPVIFEHPLVHRKNILVDLFL